MTSEELVDYCITLSASVAADPVASPILDSQLAIEFFLPAVLREATRRAFRDKYKMQHFMKQSRLSFTSGVATAPAGVEEEFAASFQLGTGSTPGADMGIFSYYPEYGDFIRETDVTFPYFTVQAGKIFAKPSASMPDGPGVLMGVTVPQIPDDGSDIAIGDTALDDALLLASSVIRGETPIAAISLPYVLPKRSRSKV